MKKFIAILIASMMLLASCGSSDEVNGGFEGSDGNPSNSNSNSSNVDTERNDHYLIADATVGEIITKCEKMYGDTFTIVDDDANFTAGYNEIILHSQKFNTDISVWVSGEGEITSNYMPIKFKSSVEAKIKPLVSRVYGDCIVSNSPVEYGSEKFTPDMKLETYMKDPDSGLSIYIAVAKESTYGEDDLDELVGLLKDNNILTSVSICYYDDLSGITATNDDLEPFSVEETRRLNAVVDTDYSLSYMEWIG